MFKQIPSILIALLLLLSGNAFSQTDSAHITTIATKLQKLTATQPAEKVYLHFNKLSYSAGDTIWFKGYVTVGVHHQPSALSGVLYVELLDSKDKVVKSIMLKNDNGISAGEFVLDAGLLPGNYRIRAYTTWMRNFGNEYFFNQTITVGSMETDAVLISPSYSMSANEAINTKLAYTDKLGRPYEHREVDYEVRADSNLLYKAKGITDASGNLVFTFPGQTAPKQQVKLISHFKLASGIVIDKTVPLNIVNGNTDVQFFPEGGQLINGVRSRVAFKAIGTNGLGVEVKGVVLDNENNEVAEFQSQHLGMGVFALTPQNGKTYTAKITLGNDFIKTFNLPLANDKGFVLAVNNNPTDSTKLNIRIATNETTLSEKKEQRFFIVGQSNGVIYYTTAGKLDNVSFTASVPKINFQSGIAQFTLFSDTNEPLNERVVFIQNSADILNLSLSSSKGTYAAKEKTILAFNAKDNNGEPAQGNFSLSVYNDDENAGENNESTILSNILLTSDLKGYIEQPNYYFNYPNSQTQADLDVLLLTQGYRRFDWPEIINDQYPQLTYQPERSLTISGQITTSAGKPIAERKVSVLSLTHRLSIDTISNTQGRFTLNNLDFTDTTQLLVKARKDANDNNVIILLDKHTQPAVYKSNYTNDNVITSIFKPSFQIRPSGNADTIQIASEIRKNKFSFGAKNELKTVTVKERKNAGTELAPWVPKVPDYSANLNGPGHADKIFVEKDMEYWVDFLPSLINHIPGIDLAASRNNGPQYFFTRHEYQSFKYPPYIKFMLDGNFVEWKDLEGVFVNTVQSVEILYSGSYLSVYGTQTSGGLIIITTRKGNSADLNKDYNAEVSPGVITTKFVGFYKAKEFYVPKYIAKNTNDARTAVYWNPNVATDANGNFPIEYFNSDIKGSYKAVVEGIDNDGNIGRYVYRYKVE